jgi:hypothetical protein
MPLRGEPVGVLIFSLEMSSAQLALRMLCSRARVNMKLLRDGLLSKNGEEQARLLSAADQFSKAPIFIDDSSALSIMQLRAKARRIHARHPLGFIVVDYLQLDCEPSKSTFEILTSIPFDDYKFAVITYEHDHYVDMTKTYRQKSRNYLRSLGYLMAVNDISPDGVSTFEDWWYHPELIDPVIAQKMSSVNDDIKKAEDFMLGKV